MILIRDATGLNQYKFDDSKELIGASSKGLVVMRDSAESNRTEIDSYTSQFILLCQSLKFLII